MHTRLLGVGLAIAICTATLAGDQPEERKAGKPKEVSVVFTVSNSLDGPLEVYLAYQIKKNQPITEILVGTVPAQKTGKFHERVVYNGLVGPNGKDGAIRIFVPNTEDPLAQYSFFVDNEITQHNAKGNRVNSKTEQIDIALLPDFSVTSVNPKHR